ncbi:MAG: GNAT family N-acetyltransferase [Paracoccaceae bacterium]
MQINSPGILSDFIFHDFVGEVTDLGDCIAVRTPSNPSYFYGNYLIFPAPPKKGDFGRWRSRFDQVFKQYPGVLHHCFAWKPSAPANRQTIAEFQNVGFMFDTTSVLTATSVHTEKPAPPGVDFRSIKTDFEWVSVIDAQTSEGFPSIPMPAYRAYKEATFANYRAMSEAGRGAWWGAFKGVELVADLGLFFGRGIGRFQSVETLRAHRRQGICRALVHHVSNAAFAAHPGITLMLHADADEVARTIYQSVGYEETESLQSLFRPPVTR